MRIVHKLQCSDNGDLVSAQTGGECGQAWTGGGGLPKIPKFVRTSFMDDPFSESKM